MWKVQQAESEIHVINERAKIETRDFNPMTSLPR